MYIGRDLPGAEDGATRLLGYDISATLASGETISGVTSSLALLYGSDLAVQNNPQARFVGNPATSGSDVTQACAFIDPLGSLVGNVYRLSLAATTSLGQVIIPWARITIQVGYGIAAQITNMPPLKAQIIVLPSPGPKFTVPTLGGYAGQDLPVADQGEARLYGFDLSPALSAGEIVQSAAFALISEFDQDGLPPDLVIANNPSAYFAGSSIISGSVAQQMVAWPFAVPPIVGNAYILSLVATTSFNQAIETWSRVVIET
jgi:hypothetical protein